MQALQAVSIQRANIEGATQLGIGRFVHLEGQVLSAIQVKKSNYGSRAAQSTTSAIGPARWFGMGGKSVMLAHLIYGVAHTCFLSTVNSEDIRNYENQIGKAREESARAERQVAQIEVERKKRLVEKEKLQGTVVSHPYVGVA